MSQRRMNIININFLISINYNNTTWETKMGNELVFFSIPNLLDYETLIYSGSNPNDPLCFLRASSYVPIRL